MKIGVSKVKVIFRKKNLPLLGYGQMNHIANEVENDLHARAFMFRIDQEAVAILHLESAFVSHHLKVKILERFNAVTPAAHLTFRNLLFTANNTHSAPAGFSHYAFFNITSKGFIPEVFEAYQLACVDALQKAWIDLEESKIVLNASYFEDDVDVAFNRSIEAYNSNTGFVELDENQSNIAVNRLVRQIQISRDDTSLKGVINWFGVQGTSIPATAKKIHPDNKGYAASFLENDQTEDRQFVAGFCMEAAADVSPNYHGRAKWWPRGKYEDPYKSAYFNGFIQFEKSKAMLEDKSAQITLSETINSVHAFIDFSDVVCDKKFCADGLVHKTDKAILGSAFAEGTPIDNPGIDSITSVVLNSAIKVKGYVVNSAMLTNKDQRVRLKALEDAHGPKMRMIDLQEKQIIGNSDLTKLSLPAVATDIIDEIKRQYRAGALKENTWTPIILPIQIIRIGDVAILGLPGEITTEAGNQLRKAVIEILEPIGIIDIVISSCSNEYGGYISTFDEYQLQHFEGACTLFGQYTLAAFQTEFCKLAHKLINNSNEDANNDILFPPSFSEAELKLRTVGQP
jgi:neutral ceramidase